MGESDQLTYEQTGVANTGDVLGGLLHWVNKTLQFRHGRIGDSCMDIGFYANVLDLGHGLGLAISTDGVGTKILIAEMMGRYDTIGIDCIAMNVNDLICVGAEPIAMMDYLAVSHADPHILSEIGKGLYAGCKDANISIPGGELAQLGQMIGGLRPGEGLDLVGACFGIVQKDRMLIGQNMKDGDVILGLASTGVHSNGYTLAREALFTRGGLTVHSNVPELDCSVGEELLKPTRIYVKQALAFMEKISGLRAMAHITSDGFLNLLRIPGSFSYQIDQLPPVPAIFNLIQERGGVPTEEMYRVFNMGIGLCVIVDSSQANDAIRISEELGVPASRIGRVYQSATPEVTIIPAGLCGTKDLFYKDGTPRA